MFNVEAWETLIVKYCVSIEKERSTFLFSSCFLLFIMFLLASRVSRTFVRPKYVAYKSMCSLSDTFVKYDWQDPLNLESLLTEEERMMQ